jgi:hypothetical protein
LILTTHGCSDDSGTTPKEDGSSSTADGSVSGSDSQQDAKPTAEFKALTAYDGIQGTTKVEVSTSASVSKVELLADGKVVATATETPFTLDWDSTQTNDGIVKLSLKAHATTTTTTSEELPVVIYNNGEKAVWIAGNSATMTINSAVDSHVKFHWNMTDGFKQVIGILWWDNGRFKMQLDLGTGTCPHSGELAASNSADKSPVVTVFPETPSGNLTACQWFAHAACTNEPDLEGKSTELKVEVYTLK